MRSNLLWLLVVTSILLPVSKAYSQSSAGALGGSESLLLILITAAIVIYLIKRQSLIDVVSDGHNQMFEDTRFSTQDFYGITESFVKEKQIPGLSTSRVHHQVGGLFSGKREYLRVTYKEYFFDICAAPFAKDFFVSWRQGLLKQIVKRRRSKTFYEEDTEAMFKTSIKLSVERALNQLRESKGIRQTAELVN